MPRRNTKSVCKWTAFKRLEDLNMSKGDLARALDISPQAVNARWKNGWNVEALSKLCDVLGLEEDQLVVE